MEDVVNGPVPCDKCTYAENNACRCMAVLAVRNDCAHMLDTCYCGGGGRDVGGGACW